MHTDPIADVLTRIRNAQAVGKATVIVTFSRINLSLLKTLQKHAFIKEVHTEGEREIIVTLMYEKDKEPKIKYIKRISTPGRKVYVDKKNLPRVLNDFGLALISTSKGLMTNKEARVQGIGGEVICEIY